MATGQPSVRSLTSAASSLVSVRPSRAAIAWVSSMSSARSAGPMSRTTPRARARASPGTSSRLLATARRCRGGSLSMIQAITSPLGRLVTTWTSSSISSVGSGAIPIASISRETPVRWPAMAWLRLARITDGEIDVAG